MPPPRAEEVEDSSGSDSADSGSDSDVPVAVAVAPAASAVVTVEAASARAAALAEQLAARTVVPVEGTASPGRPKETAAPGDGLSCLNGRKLGILGLCRVSSEFHITSMIMSTWSVSR